MLGQLIVTVPDRMNVLFEGVNAVSNIAISVADIPGSVVECCSSKLVNFTSSDALTHVFLVSGHVFVKFLTRYPFEAWT